MNSNVEAKVCKKKFLTTRTLTVIAMLSALATILMLFEIPLWFAPSFYELDFSEVPVLIGAFSLGPMAGVVIELVKVLLNLVMNGTITMGVGEFANFLIGVSFVIPASLIYYRKRTFKNAVIGLTVGTVSMSILGSILNALVLLPAYAFFMNIPLETLIQMGSKVNPSIVNVSTFVIFAVVPFNLLKGVVVSIVTILLYKQLSILIRIFTKE